MIINLERLIIKEAKMSKFEFNHKKKKYILDVKECRSVLEKTYGLMFRKKSKPLLFIFNKPVSEGIHSFFCSPFLAIWFLKNKIIEIKYVKPNAIYVKPKEKFDKLLEIPSDNRYFKVLSTG